MNSLDANAEVLFGALADPAGPALPVQFRQGVIMSFNRLTLENTVRVGGTVLTNLPILGVGETAALSVDDVVAVLVIGRSMAILGQMVVPGTSAAETAISLLSANTYSASADDTETEATVAAWHDLASPGPVVENVVIGPSGRCLVYITAALTVVGGTSGSVNMGYEISGATAVAAGANPQYLAYSGTANTGISATCVASQSGLNAGTHTFTAKYQSPVLAGGAQARYNNRNLTVVAL